MSHFGYPCGHSFPFLPFADFCLSNEGTVYLFEIIDVSNSREISILSPYYEVDPKGVELVEGGDQVLEG